jgi:long-chain fatty acid transport protein
MKKVFTCVGGLLLSFACVSAVYGGAIDNKTNWSAEYIRTLNRNAATDYADIAAYNPAGTVKLQDGFIINGSAQYLGKDYTNNVNDPAGTNSFNSDEGSVVPGVFGVYNRDKWSLFGAVTVVGGGGKVDFSEGSWTTRGAQLILIGMSGGTLVAPGPAKLTAESYYLGYTLGGAYEINDIFSVSVGLRYVDAHLEAQGSGIVYDATLTPAPPVVIDYEEDGDGWGGIFGLNIAPNDKFNIGMRYETKTNLDLEATVKQDTYGLLPLLKGVNNGTARSRDLPALFAIGVSYWVSPQLRLETNYTQYLNSNADWGGTEDLVNDGYDVGIALEYHFNDSLLGSIGYLRTETGINPEDMLPENPELDANTIGGGIAYAFTEKFHTNFSLGYVFYEDDSFTQPLSAPPNPLLASVEYEKKIYFLALGLEYRF